MALYFATAVLILELYNKLSASLMRAFTSNKSLLKYPMIKEPDTLFARLSLIACTFIVINVIFYSGLIVFGLGHFPAHPELVVFAFLTREHNFFFFALNCDMFLCFTLLLFWPIFT